MEDSSEQNWNNREFSLVSISDLSSDASSVSPGIASFKPDRLQIQPESQQIPLNFDLQTAQVCFYSFPIKIQYFFLSRMI